MIVNDVVISIHPPMMIRTTAEVQRTPPHHTPVDGDSTGEAAITTTTTTTTSEALVEAHQCHNTISTNSTSLSTLSGEDQSSSSISTPSLQQHTVVSGGDDHHMAMSRARRTIRDAIDFHPISKTNTIQSPVRTITHEQAALALIQARQQLRQQDQHTQLRTPPPPSSSTTTTNDHPSDESMPLTHLHRDNNNKTNISSPLRLGKEQPQFKTAKKSMILTHYIDRNSKSSKQQQQQQHLETNDDIPLTKQETTTTGPNEERTTTLNRMASLNISSNNNESSSTATTPDTSRSSSPSMSMNHEDDHCDVHVTEKEVADATMNLTFNEPVSTVVVSDDIGDNIRNIDKIDQNNDTNMVLQNVTKEDSLAPKSEEVEWTTEFYDNNTETDNVITQSHCGDVNLSNDIYYAPDSSFDATPLDDASPMMVQKVADYIDLVTSSIPQLNAESAITNEIKVNVDSDSNMRPCQQIRYVEDTSLSNSQSFDGQIDPKMMNCVTSSVRDYIDSMHEHKCKTTTDKCLETNAFVDEEFILSMEISKSSEVDAQRNNVDIQTSEEMKSFDVNTKPDGSTHTHGLIEYLSTKASTKNENNNTFGIDPPSFDMVSQYSISDDDMKHDPPLNLTESEVARSSVVEPEVNPFKDFTFDADCHNDDDNKTATDPDVIKSAIMHDDIGEPSSKSNSSNSIDEANSSDICNTHAASTSFHVCSERVIRDTPNRKTIVLTLPSLTMVDDVDEIRTKDTFEPDGLYPSNEARDFALTIQNLHYLLTGNDDVADIDIQQFRKLVRFSSSFIDRKLNITSYGTSQIMSRANELNVTLAVTDRYLDSIRSMSHESSKAFADLEDLNNMIQLLRDLNTYLEVLTSGTQSELLRVDVGVISSSLVNISDMPSDTFEVEANDGYMSKDFGPTDDEEPWWEVVARLNGTPCQIVPKREILHVFNEQGTEPPVKQASSSDETEKASESCVERDIAKFWTDREKLIHQHEQDVLNMLPVGAFTLTKAHSYSGQDVATNCRKSRRITKTRSQSSSASNISQHSLQSIRRKWSGQQSMATTKEQIPKLNAVSATSAFFDKENKSRVFRSSSNLWRQSYAERTQNHDGYFDVDKYSLYTASTVQAYRHSLDCVAWESRSVKQCFMYEQSISFTRNWFGCLTEINANLVIKEPVCRPKSMEMPMEADEWTEEWFLNRHRLCYREDNDEYDDDLWEDIPPECGKIRNVRLRPGEKITRVTPYLTSHLRRSRWRKKHFPSGTCPYV